MFKSANNNFRTPILAALILSIGACALVELQTNTQDSSSVDAEAQSVQQLYLPSPTGPFSVGVTTWHWIDASRVDAYASRTNSNRELMVHAWYPAKPSESSEPAPYRPLARNDHDVIHKNSIAGAPFASLSSGAPIILLCPGRGVSSEYNTSLAEELASHGYAVFAVDSPYIGRVDFPDGRHVSPLPVFSPSRELMMGPYENVDAFFEDAVELGSEDNYFVLEQINELNNADPANRFTGKLDLSSIGIYGHSLGGRICGEVAATTPAIKAFAAMEAVPPRDRRRNGLTAAVLMMYSSDFPEDLALPNMEEIIPNRKADVFFARFEGMGHNSSTDLPLITGQYPYETEPEDGLRIMRLALLEFFNAYLMNGEFPNEVTALEQKLKIRSFLKPETLPPK